MQLKNIRRTGLLDYLERQLAHFFPDGRDARVSMDACLDDTLARLEICINAVRMWKQGEFDYLHSSQYATFLYYLANTLWRRDGANHADVCDKLFFLNKALNGIDCFYEIEMPSVFFIGHSVGIVLAKATYGNYLVLYQNSTVGKNHGVAPVLGEGVVMYPNTAIIGRCRVGDRSVISQGTSVINQNTPEDCLVFNGEAGGMVFKNSSRNITSDIFR